ncbi:hypothetical protein PPERSA_12767 [Pseudocohnilembus persalinus]|uniref:peptidylprolyl isomerase n=1 Tax=Pseudocohnilembus persalinus TaxID=266149 RepID=A0A0V0QUQ1_PSEPJ|nr:hypothetical protein PPERSA_12767 [Pseudocohnilembus persalinus]|eukprot:KRX05589.1 hypothetical protein PPERSA_12767 [Pseudocohnilembus persalinus]
MDLLIKTLKGGDNKTFPQKGKIVRVRYSGAYENGIKFDSNEVLEFQIGASEVIEGWEMALPKMSLGEKIQLTVPPKLGYDNEGLSDIVLPNSTLIFEIELLSIK